VRVVVWRRSHTHCDVLAAVNRKQERNKNINYLLQQTPHIATVHHDFYVAIRQVSQYTRYNFRETIYFKFYNENLRKPLA